MFTTPGNRELHPDEPVFLDKFNHPIEAIAGHPIISFLRRVLHTRKIVTYAKWRAKDGFFGFSVWTTKK